MQNIVASIANTTPHVCAGPDDTPFGNMRLYLDALWRERLLRIYGDRGEQTPNLYILKTRTSLTDTYLEGFPQEWRQHHNCNACRKFLETMGALGELKSIDGEMVGVPVFFSGIDLEQIPDHYRQSIKNVMAAITPYVNAPFILDTKYRFNKGVTGEWSHLAVPEGFAERMIHASGRKFVSLNSGEEDKSPTAIMGTLTSYYQTLVTALERVGPETALRVDALFRSDKTLSNVRSSFRDQMSSFAVLARVYAKTKNAAIKSNLLWNAAVGGDPAIISFHNTLVGKLCLDIQSGDYSEERAIKNFVEDSKGIKYQRPKGDPSEGLLNVAENLISSMNLERSFERRFLNRDEVDPSKVFTIWQKPERPAEEETAVKSAVVDRVRKNLSEDFPGLDNLKKAVDGGKISVDKLFRILGSGVVSLQLVAPARSCAWVFHTTAVHMDAPLLVRHDTEARRNPVLGVGFANPVDPEIVGIRTYTHVDVIGIGSDPVFWEDENNPDRFNMPVLYMAEGSMRSISSSAIFPNAIISELYPIRKVIEKISDTGRIEASEGSLIGYCLVRGSDQGIQVIVTKDDTKTMYHLGAYEALDAE